MGKKVFYDQVRKCKKKDRLTHMEVYGQQREQTA